MEEVRKFPLAKLATPITVELMASLQIADLEVNRRLIWAILLSYLEQIFIQASNDSNILNIYAVSMNSTSLLQFITSFTFRF